MWGYSLLSAYIAGCLYVFVRGWQSLEILKRNRLWVALIYWIFALSFVLLRMRLVSGALYDFLYFIGFLMLAFILKGFLILLAIDILRIFRWAAKIKPDFIYRNYQLSKAFMFGAVCFVLITILVAGYFNAQIPRATQLTIAVDKNAGQLATLRIAMVSDVHLGNIYGRKSLARTVNLINKHSPDIVFLVGDIFDGNPEPVINDDMGVEFSRLQTKYGVYFANGNHERLRDGEGRSIAIDYLASRGVQPLLDERVLIDSSFYVVGRKDRSTRTRKTIPELLNGIDERFPVILLDHQPYNLEEAEKAGVDLQLSGHTHRGQMFPLNFVTGKIYERDWGFLQKGKTKFYISCGVGTWGPPIRTVGFAEVVIIDIFSEKY